jgi:hypothetical protein
MSSFVPSSRIYSLDLSEADSTLTIVPAFWTIPWGVGTGTVVLNAIGALLEANNVHGPLTGGPEPKMTGRGT